MKKIIYAKYNRTRNPIFQTSTRILIENETKYVEKAALTSDAKQHIQAYEEKYNKNLQMYQNIRPLKGEGDAEHIVFPFVSGYSAKSLLDAKKKNASELCAEIEKCFSDIFLYQDSNVCEFQETEDFVNVFGYSYGISGQAVKCSDIDIIFDNIIYSDGQWYSIDYEWTFDFPIPINFIKYRMLYRYYYNERIYFEEKMTENEFFQHFGLGEEECAIYAKWELSFQYYVYGEQCKYVYPERYKKISVDFQKLATKYGNLEQTIDKYETDIVNCQDDIAKLKNDIRQLELTLQHSNNELNAYKGSYEAVLNSLSWKITNPIRLVLRGINCIREHGFVYTVRYMFTKKSQPQMTISRENKMPIFEVNEDELEEQRRTEFQRDITFSILVPLYNTPELYLRDMIDSVIGQTYSNWELCLADGSDAKHEQVEKICQEYEEKDTRIRYKKLEKNEGISGNTNACIAMAQGDYIALFDHDDVLHASALYECMQVIEKHEADYIYTDEMTFVDNIKNVINVHYKPDYSPDTLRSYNYICHLSVFKKQLLDVVGGFQTEYDGSQDYDLILRLTEQAKRIVHIPKVLYFWRAHEKSVAQDISAKPYTLDAAKRALSAHLERVGLEGDVYDAKIPSVYKVNYKISGCPKISILIPNKDHIDELKVCLDSIYKKSSYGNFEVVIVENNSEEEKTFQYYEEIQNTHSNLKVVYWEKEFNYSAINNFGLTCTEGEYVILLNNDVEILTENWMEEMLMFAQRPEVGAVGAMLYYPDDTIQHAGVILGIGGVAGHSHKYYKRGEYGYASRLMLAQNLSAVTAACMMVKRSVYEELQGLDENFKVAFNDVDFCMRIREKGYLIVFTPFAELYHYESKSRGLEDTEEKQMRFKGEVDRFMDKWQSVLEQGDPYYNPNLTLIHEDFSFK